MIKKRVKEADRFGKVAVLMGGWSSEREISLQSGEAVLDALLRQEIDAFGIDVQRDVLSVLETTDFDRAFIALHGKGGEDGVIQGVLEALDKPYTGSGILASSVSMDKLRTKQMWMGAGLRTPQLYITKKKKPVMESIVNMGFPVMVKPIREGSSIGMSKVNHEGELLEAWEKAREFDQYVMAEKFIEGTEYTAAILGHRALPLVSVATPHSFFDFNAKYEANDTVYYCPCGLETEREKELKTLCLMAFGALGATGWGRIDFILDEQDVPWLIENNTVPGLTDHSLVPMAAQVDGMNFDELVVKILESSLKTREESE
jgi:D-alanine-D-alanine ligase